MGGVCIYDKELFTRCFQSKVIRSLGCAPGGEGGVDVDIQYELGAKGAEIRKERVIGICTGIVASWLIGFCHGRSESKSCIMFEHYYRNALRFQGAYLKYQKGTWRAIDEFNHNQLYDHGLQVLDQGALANIHWFQQVLPQEASWGGFLGVTHHSFGVGQSSGNSYFIMEPNAGLFTYLDRGRFIADFTDLCLALFFRKNLPSSTTIKYVFYRRRSFKADIMT